MKSWNTDFDRHKGSLRPVKIFVVVFLDFPLRERKWDAQTRSPFLHLNKLRSFQGLAVSSHKRHRYLQQARQRTLLGTTPPEGNVHKSLGFPFFSRLSENAFFKFFILRSASAPRIRCITDRRPSPAGAIGGPGIVPHSCPLPAAAWQIPAHHR